MFVKPAPGMAVRDPDLRDMLPAEGREVARTDYWLRRLLDGDAIEVDPKKPAPRAADEKEAR